MSHHMTCPKCGFEQPEAAECSRCGIFVAKYSERARVADETRLIQESIAQRQLAYATGPSGTAARSDDFFAPEKKGVENGMLGGIAMMVLAVVWFGLGWMAGIIFFYPPILFLFGVFAFLKGMFTGNVAG